MKDKIDSHNTSDNWHSVYADIANLVGEENILKIYKNEHKLSDEIIYKRWFREYNKK